MVAKPLWIESIIRNTTKQQQQKKSNSDDVITKEVRNGKLQVLQVQRDLWYSYAKNFGCTTTPFIPVSEFNCTLFFKIVLHDKGKWPWIGHTLRWGDIALRATPCSGIHFLLYSTMGSVFFFFCSLLLLVLPVSIEMLKTFLHPYICVATSARFPFLFALSIRFI